jgi:hypothetical protein
MKHLKSCISSLLYILYDIIVIRVSVPCGRGCAETIGTIPKDRVVFEGHLKMLPAEALTAPFINKQTKKYFSKVVPIKSLRAFSIGTLEKALLGYMCFVVPTYS